MAIDDLQGLNEQLPEVFDVRTPPPAWGSDWIIVAIDDPESSTASIIEAARLNEPAHCLGAEARVHGASSVATPRAGGPFPGSPAPCQGATPYPPPDALAFYLPFHYYFPDWWGVYLTVEGLFGLGSFI